jgi:hypothetical protein
MREQNPDISGVPEVLLNPGGSSPVPYYELPLADVHELGKSSVPMRLTNEELDVVTNSTMVLGRSGTGNVIAKTINETTSFDGNVPCFNGIIPPCFFYR